LNKDKRVVAQVLADLCTAYSTQRTVPNKVLIIIRDSVKGLADSEERSLKKMEPFKDNLGTALNYQNGISHLEDLRAAQDALEEGEIDEAAPLLARVAQPVTAVDPEPVKRKARGTK
jgi:hypothetical protein